VQRRWLSIPARQSAEKYCVKVHVDWVLLIGSGKVSVASKVDLSGASASREESLQYNDQATLISFNQTMST